MPDDTKKDDQPVDRPLESSLTNESLMAVESESSDSVKSVDDSSTVDESTPAGEQGDTLPAIPAAVASVQKQGGSSHKKHFIIAGIVALIVTLLIGGAVAAYMWYTNPEKVLLDGVTKAMLSSSVSVNGTVHYDMGDTSVDVTMKGGGDKTAGATGTVDMKIKPSKDIPSLSLSAESVYIAKDGTSYFKIAGLQKAYDKAVDAYMDDEVTKLKEKGYPVSESDIETFRSFYDSFAAPLIKQFDNQWIKVTAADVKDFEKESGKQYDCTQNAYKKITEDKTIAYHVVDTYDKNKFLDIRQSSRTDGDSNAYTITVDDTKLEAFKKALEASVPSIKALNDCESDNTSTNKSVKIKNTQSTYTVWANKWDHTITKVSYAGSGKVNDDSYLTSLELMPTFNTPVSVSAPTGAKSLKDLKESINKAYGGILGTSSTANDEEESESTYSNISA